ncbi:mitochondrial ribosomal protein subunit L20-domain-containing protein, partial [Vararia minispora EC-137]
ERPPMRWPDPLTTDPDASISKLPEDLTFIRRSPPSHPTELSYTSEPASPLLRPAAPAPEDTPLPPPLRDIRIPKTRLTDEQIRQMRHLRMEKPIVYTQKRLAKMFNTTPSTVGMVATLPQAQRTAARRKFFAEHEAKREEWGEKKRTIREIRAKRREFW